METKIAGLIRERGPLTGQELLDATQEGGLSLWRACKTSRLLSMRSLGTRYLRLDRRIEGYARLSPSILREFLTYSVVGLAEDREALNLKADAILSHIAAVSRSKRGLAYNVISSLLNQFSDEAVLREQSCFVLAGDIVYDMAHDVPRPERSTGKMVNGSDMDIVVIVDDLLPGPIVERLDEAIYQEKCRLLITPHVREEIDYVVKGLERVREQLRFDTFKHMVACKILHEGAYLYGSDTLFQAVKSMLREYGVEKKLRDLEKKSDSFRQHAEHLLLHEDPDRIRTEFLNLFYPVEESEEFE
ncbi:MAG: hypothetical protein ACOWYE_12510 [Desulfatiglandales bacterium]